MIKTEQEIQEKIQKMEEMLDKDTKIGDRKAIAIDIGIIEGLKWCIDIN